MAEIIDVTPTKVDTTSRRHPSNGIKKGERRGGRKKGTPNKVNANLKAMILGALHAKDGQKYLERVAEEDPKTFCALLGRVLPMTVVGDPNKPIDHRHEITFRVISSQPKDAN